MRKYGFILLGTALFITGCAHNSQPATDNDSDEHYVPMEMPQEIQQKQNEASLNQSPPVAEENTQPLSDFEKYLANHKNLKR